MFIGKQSGFKAALAAGLSMPLSFERKDDEVTPGEVKGLVEQLSKTIVEFRTKNDERLAQIEKKGEDAITVETVEKLNKAIDDQREKLEKQLASLEAKANRMGLGSTPEGAAEIKAAREFGRLIKSDAFTVEQLSEYKSALGNFIRLNEVKAQSMSVAQDPSGGYWVTPDTNGRMVKKVYESTPMRQLANVVSIGTDALEGPIDNGDVDALWIGESAVRNETDAAQVGQWRIAVNELYAFPKATQKLLEDSMIDVERWLGDKATSKFSRKENAAFINGDGVLKPQGLMTYDAVATDDTTRPWGKFQYIPSGAGAGFAATNPADALVDLMFGIKNEYRQNANFLMARKTMAAIRKLKDGQGNYLVDLRLRDNLLVESIFGSPVVTGEDMPAYGTANNLPIAYGDFEEAYTIVDRLGISIIRDNITQPGFVRWLMRKRVGGGAVNFEAVKFLKLATS